MFAFLYLIICYSLIPNQCEAAKILAVFPIPSISHQVVFRPLTQELAWSGHDVTVITADPAFPKGGTPPNLTEIDLHDISYKIWREGFLAAGPGNEADIIGGIDLIFKTQIKVFDRQFKDEKLQNLINDKSKQFDLVLAEACARPAVVFSYLYKAPLILVSSFGAFFDNYEVVGAPIHPLLYPSFSSSRIYNLTIWDKFTELYNYYMLERLQKNHYVSENNLLRSHFGPDVPPIQEIYNNVSMLFLNVHPVFEGNRPVPPSVVYMGGLHQKPDTELPKDLKSFLDSSKNGVIYVSFGTNVDPTLLPPEKVQAMVQTLSGLPYDALWKWNKDELPGRTENIKISKWLPQSDLLKHPKIKLFITQGGLQSTDEAITAGVPLVGVPMLGDQWFNVEKYVYHQIGVRLDLDLLTEETFKTAINTVIEDSSYRQNIVRLGQLMRDEPMRPLDRAVWWTEHVLRHGGAGHLRAPASNMSWTEYLELELVFIILLGLLVATVIFIMILNFIYKNVIRKYFLSTKIKRS